MKRVVCLLLLIVVGCHSHEQASDLFFDIYKSCLSHYSVNCVKPKALAWISNAVQKDEIPISDDLSIIRIGNVEPLNFDQEGRGNGYIQFLDKIDEFISTHAIRVNPPKILRTQEARSFMSTVDQNDLASPLEVPLSNGNVAEGRGFLKKVMIPFLLGVKLNTTVLVPLTVALIALKTWKALTLGLLSMVLSAAMVIFKLAKPKIVNYEVVHYPPHHVEHHVDHHVDHHVEHPPHIEHPPPGWEPHGWSRQFDAQNLAYNGYLV